MSAASFSTPAELWALDTALDTSVDNGPFGYQLVHGDPEIDEYIRNSLADGHRPTSYQNYMANPTPGLMFYATQSSSGYHVNGLPLESRAHIDKHPEKLWTRYSHFGFLEINDALFAAICPADLNNRRCYLDEIWCWDPDEGKWCGGCQMLRLCHQLQTYPRPAPPALTPFQYALHVSETAHHALMKIQAGDPQVTSLFTAKDGATTEYCLPLLGTTELHQWPVLVHAGCGPKHPAHIESCSLLHGIRPTCLTLQPHPRSSQAQVPQHHHHHDHHHHWKRRHIDERRYEQICARHDALTCRFDHDFETARRKSLDQCQAHLEMAQDLMRAGQAVRVQRRDDGIRVWVTVRGYRDQHGTKGRFVIDGDSEVRKTWDIPHTLGWCWGCNPVLAPAPVPAPAPAPETVVPEERMMRLIGDGDEVAQSNGVGDHSSLAGRRDKIWKETVETIDEGNAEGVAGIDSHGGISEFETPVTLPWQDDVEDNLLAKWRSVLGR